MIPVNKVAVLKTTTDQDGKLLGKFLTSELNWTRFLRVEGLLSFVVDDDVELGNVLLGETKEACNEAIGEGVQRNLVHPLLVKQRLF